MRVKEFICHTLNALLGGIAGGALGVGIAWGICQLWLALDHNSQNPYFIGSKAHMRVWRNWQTR